MAVQAIMAQYATPHDNAVALAVAASAGDVPATQEGSWDSATC